MTTLVSGASGFTGSHVVRALVAAGRPVRALARPTSDLSRLGDTRAEVVHGDLGDPSSLQRACDGVSVVIHTAAYVDLGRTDADAMHRVNVDGTRALLAAAQRAGVARFVHCSTIGVLGDTDGLVVDETFLRRQVGFSGAYDRTKFEAQTLVNQANGEGITTVSVLPSGIFGPGDPHFGPVIARFRAGRLPYWPALDRPTGIVDVADVADALILAADKGEAGARYIASAGELTLRAMFNILSPEVGRLPPKALPEVATRCLGAGFDLAARLFRFKPPLDLERVHYLYDRCVRVDAAKARRDLGWSPLAPKEIVRRLIR